MDARKEIILQRCKRKTQRCGYGMLRKVKACGGEMLTFANVHNRIEPQKTQEFVNGDAKKC